MAPYKGAKNPSPYSAGFIIFPAEDIDPESDSKYVTIIKRTLDTLEPEKAANVVAWVYGVPLARLCMDKAYEWVRQAVIKCRYANGLPTSGEVKDTGFAPLYGGGPTPHLVEDVHMPFVISELLLQSYGGVIRLFPAWPKAKSASFTTLRAEGGFLVSSSLKNGKIGPTKIHSAVGGICRVQWPWGNVSIRCEEDGKEVPYRIENKIISFETQPRKTYAVINA